MAKYRHFILEQIIYFQLFTIGLAIAVLSRWNN